MAEKRVKVHEESYEATTSQVAEMNFSASLLGSNIASDHSSIVAAAATGPPQGEEANVFPFKLPSTLQFPPSSCCVISEPRMSFKCCFTITGNT